MVEKLQIKNYRKRTVHFFHWEDSVADIGPWLARAGQGLPPSHLPPSHGNPLVWRGGNTMGANPGGQWISLQLHICLFFAPRVNFVGGGVGPLLETFNPHTKKLRALQ